MVLWSYGFCFVRVLSSRVVLYYVKDYIEKLYPTLLYEKEGKRINTYVRY